MSYWEKLLGGGSKPRAAGIEMVDVPAGAFVYGYSSDAVTKNLRAFKIMKHPVTVAQYQTFCNATTRSMPNPPDWGWVYDHPVVNVSWNDATEFTTWAGLALPTRDEWTKAARGSDGRRYPWGNQWDFSKCRNSVGRRVSGTSAVGQHPTGRSPYGAEDMAGNVSEWCEDGYDHEPKRRALAGGNWNGTDSSDFLVYEPGSGLEPTYKNGLIGFRCVLRS